MSKKPSKKPPERSRLGVLAWPVAVFVVTLLVYLSNDRTVDSVDTYPTRLLPYSLVHSGDVNLDEFGFLHDDRARRRFPTAERTPYFLRARGEHYYSGYPIGPALAALPFMLHDVVGTEEATVESSALPAKRAAAILTALSAVFVFLALLMRLTGWRALIVTGVYAFGTSSLAISSQALWQHGSSQLFIAIGLYLALRFDGRSRRLPWALLPLGIALTMRSTNAVAVLPLAALALWRAGGLRARLLGAAAFAAPVAAMLLYRVLVYGGFGISYESIEVGVTSGFTQVPLLEGLYGTLFSPARGLFVYAPVLLFSIWGFAVGVRERDLHLIAAGLGSLGLFAVAAKWFMWWGGFCYGPRLLADVLPLLAWLLVPVGRSLGKSRASTVAFAFLALASVGIQLLGAFDYEADWDRKVGTDVDYRAMLDPGNSPPLYYASRRLGWSRADGTSPGMVPRPDDGSAGLPPLQRQPIPRVIERAPRSTDGLTCEARPAADEGGDAAVRMSIENPARLGIYNCFVVSVGADGSVLFHDGAQTYPAVTGWRYPWSGYMPLPRKIEARIALTGSKAVRRETTVYVFVTDIWRRRVLAWSKTTL